MPNVNPVEEVQPELEMSQLPPDSSYVDIADHGGDLFEWDVSEILSIALPRRFLNSFTNEPLPFVLPVVLADGHTYEAADVIRRFSTGDYSSPFSNQMLADLNITFNFAVYQEIKEFFSNYLIQRSDEASEHEEYSLLNLYAMGICQADPLYRAIDQWRRNHQLSILEIDKLPVNSEQHELDFASLFDLPKELDDLHTLAVIDDLRLSFNCKLFSNKLYFAPFMGYIGSLYSVIAIADTVPAFGYSAGLGFCVAALSNMLVCDYAGIIVGGGIAASTAAGVSALKYVLNTEDTLITGACASVGAPLLLYGARLVSGKLSLANRFSLWRAIPSTPDSQQRQLPSEVPRLAEMSPRSI